MVGVCKGWVGRTWMKAKGSIDPLRSLDRKMSETRRLSQSDINSGTEMRLKEEWRDWSALDKLGLR